MVITTAQLRSTKPEFRFCAGLNPACGVSEIRDGKDLWQWSRLEIRLNAFRRSTIPQKQFIIIIIINGDTQKKLLGRFRHIHAYSGIFRHNEAYSGIIQTYLGTFKTLCNSGIFKTLTYSESWNIQNPTHVQNPVKHVRWCVLWKQLRL